MFVKLASKLSSALYKLGIVQTMPLLLSSLCSMCVCECTAVDLIKIATAVPDTMEPLFLPYVFWYWLYKLILG